MTATKIDDRLLRGDAGLERIKRIFLDAQGPARRIFQTADTSRCLDVDARQIQTLRLLAFEFDGFLVHDRLVDFRTGFQRGGDCLIERDRSGIIDGTTLQGGSRSRRRSIVEERILWRVRER